MSRDGSRTRNVTGKGRQEGRHDTARLVDLSRDIRDATRFGATVELIDELVGDALEALGHVIPYDLATVMELDEGQLSVRIARGRFDSPEIRRHRLQLEDFPILREVLEAGRARAFREHDPEQGDADPFHGVLDFPHGHFCMVAPVRARDEIFGVMTLDRDVCGVYSEEMVQLADVFAKLLALVINYGEQSARLERLRRQLEEHSRLLSESVGGRFEACRLMEASRSPAMGHVLELARQVAATSAPVLLGGETGTGKEMLANAIHAWSDRRDKPFVTVNCAALPSGLIESELFGHVRGAFTGATSDRMGRFQTANGGTLFLDEVGELPAETQAKLLRVLQEGCFEPVGRDRTVRVDVRVIAATNRNLQEEVERGRFREDLYYRIAVFPIHLPPLRARREDIPVIAQNYLDALARRNGRGPWRLSREDLDRLLSREWRGNVRELLNTLERATILSRGREIRLDGPPNGPTPARGEGPTRLPTLEEVEREHVRTVLRRTGGKIHGPGGAAEILGLNPSTLRSRMKRMGVSAGRGRYVHQA